MSIKNTLHRKTTNSNFNSKHEVTQNRDKHPSPMVFCLSKTKQKKAASQRTREYPKSAKLVQCKSKECSPMLSKELLWVRLPAKLPSNHLAIWVATGWRRPLCRDGAASVLATTDGAERKFWGVRRVGKLGSWVVRLISRISKPNKIHKLDRITGKIRMARYKWSSRRRQAWDCSCCLTRDRAVRSKFESRKNKNQSESNSIRKNLNFSKSVFINNDVTWIWYTLSLCRAIYICYLESKSGQWFLLNNNRPLWLIERKF